jgi:Tfp pilus assembly protein PilP
VGQPLRHKKPSLPSPKIRPHRRKSHQPLRRRSHARLHHLTRPPQPQAQPRQDSQFINPFSVHTHHVPSQAAQGGSKRCRPPQPAPAGQPR